MNLFNKIKRYFHRQKVKKALKNKTAPLREFVYLDEVSVYSLIASRIGPIAVEFTETEKMSLQGEVASSISANAGIAKGDVSSNLLSNKTQGSGVLRKSIIQTTFKDFYESELESLTMRPISEELEPPKISNVDELIAKKKIITNNWIVDPEEIIRGQLLELEVQLETEEIFRINTVVSELLEIIREDPKIFGVDPNSELIQIKSINRILAKLLVGLIPIRGYALNFRVVEINEKEWIVHNKLLTELLDSDLVIRPLYIVGVAEQSLFWKDIRRILFSNANFRVMCRIAQSRIQNYWTPVKLSDVLESVIPDIGKQINSMGSIAFNDMKNNAQNSHYIEQKKQTVCKIMVTYAKLLAKHYSFNLKENNIINIKHISKEHYDSFDSVRERRKLFNKIADYLLDYFEFEKDPDILARYREEALQKENFKITDKHFKYKVSDEVTTELSSEEKRFIDAEFVAIYW